MHANRLRALSKVAAIHDLDRTRTRSAIMGSLHPGDGPSPRARPPRPVQPPRSRAQVVGLAGLLSSASACSALLSGELTPAAFARTLDAIESPEVKESWLAAFGSCLARLGGALQDLHGQLNRQVKSQKRAQLQTNAMGILSRVESLEESIDSLEGTARSELGDALESCKRQLVGASEELCVRPTRRARQWTRALLAALERTERDANATRAAMAAVGLATGSLTACSDAICSHACRLLGCDDACLFVATCEPTEFTEARSR